ncbi:MAG: hypothetical protein HW421_1894 [Ignavibacteria bacterium]|nr:hypothetical protein [Ignavibacteria bacterium]
MRSMLKMVIANKEGNQAIIDGTLPKIIGDLMEKIHPEAAYFTLSQGKRCGYFFFDNNDSSDMPAMLEPLFMQLNAEIYITPAMNSADLEKGMMSLQNLKR